MIDYLRRIVRFTNVEVRRTPPLLLRTNSRQKSILLVCLYTIDKICARKPQFTLSSLTCHRFIITSIAVCSKGLCDSYCPNNVYAKVGGVSVVELNLLEREFLSMIDWRLMVSPRRLVAEPCTHLGSAHATICKSIMSTSFGRTVKADSSSHRVILPGAISIWTLHVPIRPSALWNLPRSSWTPE